MKRIFSILAVLSTSFAFAQTADEHNHNHLKCTFDEHYQNALQDEQVADEMRATELAIFEAAQNIKRENLLRKNNSSTVIYTVPVVVHVIYATQADNISVAQIEDGIRVLNEDYQRLNADTTQTRNQFKGVASDMQIEFKLAKKDPSGNCTDGITRTQSLQSLSGTESAKLVKWNQERYLNIWVTRHVSNTKPSDPGGYTLGYSFFPRTNKVSGDGVILRHDAMGTIGTAAGNDGRTLTHEVGHYLALHHPFAGSCNGVGGQNPVGLLGNNYANDYCDDTPPVNQSNFGCNLSTNSCSNDNPNLVDQIENYMDYANCQNMFTEDQKARVHAVLTMSNLRSTLVSTSNHAFTGITNPPACTPEAIVDVERKVICTNESVQFFDISEEGDPTSWSWSFPGGTPATSNAENPTVTYAQPGKYSVTLSVSNSAGSDNVTYTEFISVKNSANPFFTTTWTESFENGSIPLVMSVIDGGDRNKFQPYQNAGSHQNKSLILAEANNSEGELDELISPAINTANGVDLNLFFDFAFAARNNNNTDQLEVFVSRDCGENWIRRRFYNGARLRTASNTTGLFVPNGPGQWSTESINFNAYIGPDPIIIKFVFENGGGNNFFIDNIRFGEGQDVSIQEFASADMALYPNPTEGRINLSLSDLMDRDLELEIIDLSGKTVYSQELHSEGPSLDMQLDLNLKAGAYLVNLRGENTSLQQKLLVQ